MSAKGAVEAPPLDPPPLAADDAPFVPALPINGRVIASDNVNAAHRAQTFDELFM